MKTPQKHCAICNTTFYNLRHNKAGQRIRKWTKEKWARAKYCSHACRSKDLKGKPTWASLNKKGKGKRSRQKMCIICSVVFKCNQRTDEQWEKAKYCSITCLSKSRIGIARPDVAIMFAKTKLAHPEKFIPKSGKDHWNWKGGVSSKSRLIRGSQEYIKWRNDVYARDHFTCQHCHVKCSSKMIVAHHIKTFKDYPELRFVVDNGIVLCRSCHKKVHKEIGQNTRFKKKQINLILKIYGTIFNC